MEYKKPEVSVENRIVNEQYELVVVPEPEKVEEYIRGYIRRVTDKFLYCTITEPRIYQIRECLVNSLSYLQKAGIVQAGHIQFDVVQADTNTLAIVPQNEYTELLFEGLPIPPEMKMRVLWPK
jgi:hypothetical protein